MSGMLNSAPRENFSFDDLCALSGLCFCLPASNERSLGGASTLFLGESSLCEISLLTLKSCGAKELSLDLELVLRLSLEGPLANLETLEPLVPYI